jgi:CheY-like chemotaxis protein
MTERAAARVAITVSARPSTAFFLKGVLDCAGFAATAIATPSRNLTDEVERAHPDLIVYDVTEPMWESCQTLRRLRRRPHLRHVPIVVATSDARGLYESAGVRAGIELCGDPSDVQQVHEAARRALARSNSLA